MEHLEWNKVLDNYIMGGIFNPGEWENLDFAQKFVINELKKSFKRLKKLSTEEE